MNFIIFLKHSRIVIYFLTIKGLILLSHFETGVGIPAHFRLKVVVIELQTEMVQTLQREILGKFHRTLNAKNMYITS